MSALHWWTTAAPPLAWLLGIQYGRWMEKRHHSHIGREQEQ